MTFIRRAFYLAIGCTFPGFWALHAAGYGASYYRPIQTWLHTSSTGWPSLFTALLLYLAITFCFEICWRLLKNTHP